MTKPIARDPIYRRRRFEAEIIELCVRWYITYRLSYRDLVAMLAERELAVSHTTILRWVIRYVPEFEKRWSRRAREVHSSWRVDETYISVRGKWHYRRQRGQRQGELGVHSPQLKRTGLGSHPSPKTGQVLVRTLGREKAGFQPDKRAMSGGLNFMSLRRRSWPLGCDAPAATDHASGRRIR